MIELTDLIEKRYSVSTYKPYPVEDKKLNKLLETAGLAAISDSSQPFLFVVVRTPYKKAILRYIYDDDWFIQAPVVICACAIVDESPDGCEESKNHNAVIATVADHFTLAAAREDLGTCWFTGFNPEIARRLLDLPEEVEPVACTPLGYPAHTPQMRKPKPLPEIARYEN